jgi:hypothetical protein
LALLALKNRFTATLGKFTTLIKQFWRCCYFKLVIHAWDRLGSELEDQLAVQLEDQLEVELEVHLE